MDPNQIVAVEGFDIYDDGPIVQDHPWGTVVTPAVAVYNAQISSGTGVFEGKSLSYASGPATNNPQKPCYYNFPNGGKFARNVAAANGKALFGWNGWFRLDSIASTVTARTLQAFGTTSMATDIPIFGISRSAEAGINLLFPANMASWNNAYQRAVEIGIWYWISVKFAVYPDSQVRATYTINGVPLQDNVPVIMGTDPVGVADPITRWYPITYGATANYSMDDVVLQASNGALQSWPAGFNGSVPNDPTANTLATIPPRRVLVAQVESNGSINEWTPPDGVPNYEAATNGQTIEAKDADLSDLYKFNVDDMPVTDVMAVVLRGSTNKYMESAPLIKADADAVPVTAPGLTTKGASRFVSIIEQKGENTPWDSQLLKDAEFGQKSL